jgi:hypothetical protein
VGFFVKYQIRFKDELPGEPPLTEAGTEWQDPAHAAFRQHPAQRLCVHSRRETRRRDLHQQQAGFGGQQASAEHVWSTSGGACCWRAGGRDERVWVRDYGAWVDGREDSGQGGHRVGLLDVPLFPAKKSEMVRY